MLTKTMTRVGCFRGIFAINILYCFIGPVAIYRFRKYWDATSVRDVPVSVIFAVECIHAQLTQTSVDTEESQMAKRKYDLEHLEKAVSDVNRKWLTPSKAAQEYNVPRQTIVDAVRRGTAKIKYGPNRMINGEEEAALVDYLKYMGQRGFPLSRTQFKNYVLAIVENMRRHTLFGEYGPSDKWCRKFFSRHPELAEKEPQTRDKGRARMSNQTVIDKFFKKYEETITRLKLEEKPGQIYNCDETGFSDKQGSKRKVISEKGRPCIQQQVHTIDHITAHLCASGDGKMMPTFLIYKKALPHRHYREDVPRDWMFGVSESGYMDTDLFRTWFKNIFVKHSTKERPILLLMDNHDSHISIPVIEMARADNIEILAFPVHTTHLLQPMDVNIIGNIKDKMRHLARSMALANSNLTVSKSNLPTLLSHTIDASCSPALVKSAFRKSGLIPLNKDAIDKKMLLPADFEKRTTSSSADSSSEEKNAPTPCETCGHVSVPHPISSVRNLPLQLQSIFITPTLPEQKKKNRRIVLEARTITGDTMLNQLKQKEEEEKKKADGVLQRKVERERKRASKKGESSKKSRSEVLEERSMEEDMDEDLSIVCGMCRMRDPEGDGETEWVMCDLCDEWYHTGCVDVRCEEDEDFYCEKCTES